MWGHLRQMKEIEVLSLNLIPYFNEHTLFWAPHYNSLTQLFALNSIKWSLLNQPSLFLSHRAS